jgi:hypothetical protein
MNEIRINLPTLVLLLAVTGGGAFAAGHALPSGSAESIATRQVGELRPQEESDQGENLLPPGHPPIDDQTPIQSGAAGMAVGLAPGGPDEPAPTDDDSLAWKAPARWQLVPNTSTMRLATYRVPHAPGDATDAELSVTRVGGSADANIDRWIHQFDEAGQKTAKRTLRMVGLADVAIVEVQGTYSGGMGNGAAARSGWALLGAVVATPGMPFFFKLTGPVKSVLAARGEFDALLGSLARRRDRGT